MAEVRNPVWQRDELILALDLYFRHPPSTISQTHKEVIKLSEVLNELPIHLDRSKETKFRNPNGVYMKLCNFLRVDPSYTGKGLKRGNRLEGKIWREFAKSPELLRSTAQAITSAVGSTVDLSSGFLDEDEAEFPEGTVLYRVHRMRERNKSMIKKLKQKAMTNGTLVCQVCSFDFNKEYGELGEGFIEVHHTVPISEYQEGQKTKPSDLAMVCSNCHRMLHRKRPWLSTEVLKQIRNA